MLHSDVSQCAPNIVTRDLPGDALVLKRKYNLEKKVKMAILEYFSTALKLWEITASFISLYWKHEENTPVHFWLLPVHGAMNHSGTPLWLMLRSPSFYQGANCQVWSSRFDDTWRQRPNQRLPYKLVDRLFLHWISMVTCIRIETGRWESYSRSNILFSETAKARLRDNQKQSSSEQHSKLVNRLRIIVNLG